MVVGTTEARLREEIGPEGDEAPEVPPRARQRDVRMVLTGVVAVLLVWFAIANLQQVRIHFWVFTARAPLIGVVAIAGLLGGVIGLFLRRRRRPS